MPAKRLKEEELLTRLQKLLGSKYKSIYNNNGERKRRINIRKIKQLDIEIQLLCDSNKERSIGERLTQEIATWGQFDYYNKRLDGPANLEAAIEGQLGEYKSSDPWESEGLPLSHLGWNIIS